MKILMLTWEYPPRNIGGLSNHVYHLSKALKAQGSNIVVITCEHEGALKEESDDGIVIKRVSPYNIDTEDFIKWVMHLNFSMIEEAAKLLKDGNDFDYIHIHDWLAGYAGITLSNVFGIPMIASIHSTEYGRNNGIRTVMQKYIHEAEEVIVKEAVKIIVCSNYMKEQIIKTLNTDANKISVIPNGVDFAKKNDRTTLDAYRNKLCVTDEEIVVFIGRHVYEKGITYFIDAIPHILEKKRNTKFIIAGKGPMTEKLKLKAKQLGVDKFVEFLGYIDSDEKSKLYEIAAAAVVPSLYEPFGIVALEAMAAGCPLVVSDTGGLAEIGEDGVDVLKARRGSSRSLVKKILEILMDDELASRLKKNAVEKVRRHYVWNEIANKTIKIYTE